MNILCFTGSRAEYYILRPLLRKLNNIKNINLELVVSGGITKELNKRTISDIKKDQIQIAKVIDIPKIYNNHSEIIGFLCLELSPIIIKKNPELCIVYADRFESFAFAISASHLDKILLHIEAGDITEGGTYDDYVRHCITKMSHLFCTSTKNGLEVISRLGEEPWRAIQSGLLSYEDMNLITEEDQNKVIKELGLSNDWPIIIATMHPIPKDLKGTENETLQLLKALRKFSKTNDSYILITGPNSDYGNHIINNAIENYISNIRNARFFESLGGYRYQTLMSLSKSRNILICGNSSSIIKEAPFYKAHSLNIGKRQNGREASSTQVNCAANEREIFENLEKLITYRNTKCINPYYLKDSSKLIINFIFRIFENYTKNEILDKKWNH